MTDITFTDRKRTGPELAARICQIIYGETDVRADDDGRRWRIGLTNDWWLCDLGDRQWRLTCRYGTYEHMWGLAIVLGWRLEVTVDPPWPPATI